jgi:putative cardiolipin synthase
MLIENNEQALRWRLALIDSAQHSIDLQVYIWSNDESGRLVLDRIMAASNRGVRVRLLVDDMPKDWQDRSTALVARLPNIELRRFNPGRIRTGMLARAFQMSTQFKTLNRRMHNKQLIVDGCWGIVGSRNIGNPYFGLSTKYNNRDLDVLVTGAVITEMAFDFDEFWNADAAYPGEAMSKPFSDLQKEKALQKFKAILLKDRELLKQTCIPLSPENWSDAFADLPEQMVTGTATCFQDSPVVKGDRGLRLKDQLNGLDLDVQHQSRFITPYLIPSNEQLESAAQAITEENRRIRVLVPSMASNNHTIVHSHYKKYRKRLLRMGIELFEFRAQPSAALRRDSDTAPVQSKFISLHTKAFILDERWILLGSLNLDPRSIEINTEHLLLIDAPELAKRLLADFETMCAPENAWAVTLNEKNQLRWTSDEDERGHQPGRSSVQHLFDFFYGLLPIEDQL